MFLVELIGQVAPDSSGGWINTAISALGGAGLSTALLWRVHAEDRRTISSLMSRLFLLADRATQVGQTAAEVARGDARDPEMTAALERLVALIEERNR